jgi:hypothetical protein
MGLKSSEILYRGQASTGNGTDVEDGTIPATPQSPMPAHTIDPDDYPLSRNTPTRLNSPSPVPPLDTLSGNPSTVYASETTRNGRKRKTRDLQAMLAVCTCGEAVTESEITRDESIIECRCAGCETVWVSEIVI